MVPTIETTCRPIGKGAWKVVLRTKGEGWGEKFRCNGWLKKKKNINLQKKVSRGAGAGEKRKKGVRVSDWA